jgi:hypothetical protein
MLNKLILEMNELENQNAKLGQPMHKNEPK